MKKFIAILLAAIMVLSLCACGNKDEVKPCEECGEEISLNASFCEHCGAKIEDTTTSETAPQEETSSENKTNSDNKASSENKNGSTSKPTASTTSKKPSGTQTNATENKVDLKFIEYSTGVEVVGIGDFKGTDLVIPSTYNSKKVTAIAFEAFKKCTNLTSVTIPNSVTSISNCAFSGCTSLTSVTIQNGVTSIGCDAFSGCTSLTSITIPKSVTYIDDYAFSGCTNLKNVYINDITAWCSIDFESGSSNPLHYADNLYLNNKLLTNVVIPQGVKKIPRFAFASKNITSITIPNSVTDIDSNAFAGCESLKSISIPNSVTYISGIAFYNCTSLKTIDFKGAKAQWKTATENKIKGWSGTVHCTDGDLKIEG